MFSKIKKRPEYKFLVVVNQTEQTIASVAKQSSVLAGPMIVVHTKSVACSIWPNGIQTLAHRTDAALEGKLGVELSFGHPIVAFQIGVEFAHRKNRRYTFVRHARRISRHISRRGFCRCCGVYKLGRAPRKVIVWRGTGRH